MTYKSNNAKIVIRLAGSVSIPNIQADAIYTHPRYDEKLLGWGYDHVG